MDKISTVEEFKNIVKNNKIVVVKFGAEYCGPCKVMHKTLESISNKIENIPFYEIDIEDLPEIAEITEQFNVMNIPMTVILQEGKLVDMIVGLKSESEIVEKINQIINK